MVVAVAVEVGAVALDAGAARAAIDRGIAITVDANPTAAIGRIVAGGAGCMHGGNDIAAMTVGAKRRRRHRCRMAVVVSVKIQGVATGTGGPSEDGSDLWSVKGILQGRRRGVTIGATTVVDSHRIIGRVTEGHAGRGVEDNAERGIASGRVIFLEMRRRSGLVDMTVKAVDRPAIATDHILHRCAHRGLGVDVADGIMTGGAEAVVGRQDVGPVLHRVAV